MIHLIHAPATLQQIEEMLQSLDAYIKLAVDIDRGILAGGGVMHADCESVLLEDGGTQENIWGADWNPTTSKSLLNHSSISALARTTHQWRYWIHHDAIAWLRSLNVCWGINEKLVSDPRAIYSR